MVAVFLIAAVILFSIGAGVGWSYTISVIRSTRDSDVMPGEFLTIPFGCFSLVCTAFAVGGLFACWRYFVG